MEDENSPPSSNMLKKCCQLSEHNNKKQKQFAFNVVQSHSQACFESIMALQPFCSGKLRAGFKRLTWAFSLTLLLIIYNTSLIKWKSLSQCDSVFRVRTQGVLCRYRGTSANKGRRAIFWPQTMAKHLSQFHPSWDVENSLETVHHKIKTSLPNLHRSCHQSSHGCHCPTDELAFAGTLISVRGKL